MRNKYANDKLDNRKCLLYCTSNGPQCDECECMSNFKLDIKSKYVKDMISCNTYQSESEILQVFYSIIKKNFQEEMYDGNILDTVIRIIGKYHLIKSCVNSRI